MLLRTTRTMSLIVLIMISRVVDAQDGWGVTFTPQSICAVKGSTVILGCTYKYPPGYTVQTVFWSKVLGKRGAEPPDLASDPEYRDRVQYIGDKQNNCTLKLTDVTEKDQTTYYFRFITDKPDGKYQGTDGVQLQVTGLQVEVPNKVKARTAVTLRCKTTCRLNNPTFTWYRNDQQLQTTKTDFTSSSSSSSSSYYYYSDLYLNSVRMEDACCYQCAVGNHLSSAVSLNVEYSPKNTSVSISPSGEIMENSSVTLTCRSDAKPAASYSWYKGNNLKSSGETFIFNNIRSDESGEYKCRVWNKHGDQNSTAVNINVHYPLRNFSVSISPSGEIMEGVSVTLTCRADANPPVEEYNWYKGQTHKGSGGTFTIRNISSDDSGEYKCRISYKKQNKYSGPVTVKVLYLPRNVSVSISSSGEQDQSGLVTLTCSADAEPPVENYTWYKEGGSSPVGSGESYGARPGESYYCQAQNKLGTRRSAFVTPAGTLSVALYAAVGVILVCLIVIIIIIIIAVVLIRRKKKAALADNANLNQDNVYNTVDDTAAENNRSGPDDVQYVTIVHRSQGDPKMARGSPVKNLEEAQYATVMPRRDRLAERTRRDENTYDNVGLHRTADASLRPHNSTVEDLAVIYSSVK